LTELWWW